MKAVIVGVICGLLGLVTGAVLGGELVRRASPGIGDQRAIALSATYGLLARKDGALFEPAEVRARVVTQFAQDFINAGAVYSQITEDPLRARVEVMAKEALSSGLLSEIREVDLRKESLVWAQCLAEPSSTKDVPKCVSARKPKP